MRLEEEEELSKIFPGERRPNREKNMGKEGERGKKERDQHKFLGSTGELEGGSRDGGKITTSQTLTGGEESDTPRVKKKGMSPEVAEYLRARVFWK